MPRLNQSHGAVLVIAYLGFVSLGLPDTVLGVAWPSVRDHFGRQQSESALIFIGVGASYFISSLFIGRLLGWFGVGTLLAVSSAVVALSGFGYGFAPAWGVFAACSLLHGLGSGAIDAGLNYYVSSHFAARHMSWLHAFYTLGAMLGPLIMTGVIASSASWRNGYLIVATILLGLSLLFAATRKQWDQSDTPSARAELEPAKAGMKTALGNRIVWLHLIIFFVYTGLEIAVGQWSFTVLTESRGIEVKEAGLWVSGYWASILVGRLLFGFWVDKFGIDRLLRLSMGTALLGTLIYAFGPSSSGVALLVIGLGLASVFPCMMTRTSERLGKSLARHAIGFQVGAAMIGGAALPGMAGVVAQTLGLEMVVVSIFVMALALFLFHEGLLGVSESTVDPRGTA